MDNYLLKLANNLVSLHHEWFRRQDKKTRSLQGFRGQGGERRLKETVDGCRLVRGCPALDMREHMQGKHHSRRDCVQFFFIYKWEVCPSGGWIYLRHLLQSRYRGNRRQYDRRTHHRILRQGRRPQEPRLRGTPLQVKRQVQGQRPYRTIRI